MNKVRARLRRNCRDQGRYDYQVGASARRGVKIRHKSRRTSSRRAPRPTLVMTTKGNWGVFFARIAGRGAVIARLDLKRQAPLLGSLQIVHAAGQISYLLHPSTRKDAFQRHQERAEPTHDSETAGCRSRRNKKHQRGEGKQAGGQYQSNVARQCCNQDWKQEKGEWGDAKTLQKLTQLFDMLSHYTIPAARRGCLQTLWK